ncbi:CAAX amino terminal protease family protein [Leptolyngbya boryana NIES-2135]|jgi:membrane protease YdiL (CAAX protease family)|uniref:CAAX amino terminal protease family protein n=1 Tax=Leptolyngbya boryana NIES-2135 TaxID=1973484 RepID=A0A1Z4JNC8_LEPBY|nr:MULTISPECIES: CPBP family intramembrane glutamic endopeptidase [Leptolyngbya]ULP29345.1 CPBP family intramembrane metalloprotease [Leptolyngbya boryana IU 594]BAS55584.1 CAAX amino terminal protease family [Leptolyngbya boryana IAM M-101]BAS61932.1 CAAX amino terminal protease family [Leptolyngbya boryana dg5]BAY58259.1 CAAX amino terminal protease family protein [Leptolyngbya boryana NIES-2135]
MNFPISIALDSFVKSLSQAPPLIQIGFFFLAWFLLWLPLAIPIAIAMKWRPFEPLQSSQKLPLVASLYGIAPLVLWGVSRVKERDFPTFGVSWDLHLFSSSAIGLGIGAIGILILFGVQTAIGWLHWNLENWKQWLAACLPTLVLGIWIGFTEEWVFRGFCFGEFASDFWSAAIVSSVIFSALHLIWEGRAQIPQLPGLALMGVVLCLAFVQDQNSIGLPWGLHAGWVWMIASLDTAKILRYEATAPEWGTGIDRKPLAGLLGLVFLLAMGILVTRSFT